MSRLERAVVAVVMAGTGVLWIWIAWAVVTLWIGLSEPPGVPEPEPLPAPSPEVP